MKLKRHFEKREIMSPYHDQGRIQTGLTGSYKPVRFSKERKSFTFHGCLLLILGHNSVS